MCSILNDVMHARSRSDRTALDRNSSTSNSLCPMCTLNCFPFHARRRKNWRKKNKQKKFINLKIGTKGMPSQLDLFIIFHRICCEKHRKTFAMTLRTRSELMFFQNQSKTTCATKTRTRFFDVLYYVVIRANNLCFCSRYARRYYFSSMASSHTKYWVRC